MTELWEDITCDLRDRIISHSDDLILTSDDTADNGIRTRHWHDQNGRHILTDRTWPDPYNHCEHYVVEDRYMP